MPVVPRRTIVTLSLSCALAAGCGGGDGSHAGAGSSPGAGTAQRVCGRARAAAQALVDAVTVRIADRDPANVECLLHGGAFRLDVVAQASTQAWTEFDTMQVHQVQAFGSGAVHVRSQIPKDVSEPGMLAAWIPAREELFATNGSPTRGGSYVTVTVTRGARRGAASLKLARAVARSTLVSAPRGADPSAP